MKIKHKDLQMLLREKNRSSNK
ncbi:unnamed protein product [Oikopleura dioica]|uniref:Uncharacterized protein n=1 Tax=Oikopleura dioica TaxID=34765 RepID=E4YZG1_OIKDI|nr:unnamed protein product [Oikopleura dioica]